MTEAKAKNANNEVLQVLLLLGKLFLRIAVMSLVLAYLLPLIDGLRTMGVTPFQFPFSQLGQYQPRITNPEIQDSAFLKSFDDFVFLLNCTFPGASRWGTGVGTLYAAFWTMHDTPPTCKVQRLVIGIVAGAIIGFRATLMISNSPVFIFACTLISTFGFALYMTLADRKPAIPRIPIVQMERG